jgi:adenosylcobyric acid synthase
LPFAKSKRQAGFITGSAMTKTIMVQGTMSNAGKSLITAALCRIFRQDGYKVAPFKSQNMALNSYITKEGLEMGRAQAMQAEAAGAEPSVAMNPILLKPTNDTGSQVIVNGEVLGFMDARHYYTRKQELIPHILAAFKSLAGESDIVVIEGAGSPAEINLKDVDIVNMGMAKLVGAPVLLVGDIDRGGVFASLAGTVMLLDEDEKDRVKALIINKFRGDAEILKPGLEMLEEITKKPVAGVVPYLRLEIDDEDSLSERLEERAYRGGLDIAVIRLPRISNFTDFNAFSLVPGAGVRYVSRASELGRPDMIVLPGTKNTMGDLKWLRESGLEALIIRFASEGNPVFGVCGGYQMLGETLSDPYGIEEGGEMAGMGLLPIDTFFEAEKTRTQAEGKATFSEGPFSGIADAPFYGYEIHMGISRPRGESGPLAHIERVTGQAADLYDGCQKGSVYGTYIHGLFDSEELCKALVSALFKRKGMDDSEVIAMDMASFKESQYDILAEKVRESLDMDFVYSILSEVDYGEN